MAIFAKGHAQRDISSTIEDICGFKVSHKMISDITDSILNELNEWRNRLFKKCYAFVFVACTIDKLDEYLDGVIAEV